MKEPLLCILLLAATVSVDCSQDACDNEPVRCSSCPVYTEDGGPVNLFDGTGLELSDEDTNEAFPSLQSAYVELQTDTADAADVTLTINKTTCSNYQLDCTYGIVSGKAALNITGNQSIAAYQKVLLQVKFDITADEPVLMDRMVSLKVCDEDFCSEPAIIVVAVDGINDKPPMISVRPVGRPFVEEDSMGVDIASSVIISDMDGDYFVEAARVTILNIQDVGYEWLSAHNLATYMVTITNGTTLTISGRASGSTYATILESIRYFNNASEPNVTARIIQYTIFDGMFEASDNVTITIEPRNDNPPMLTVSTLPSFTEGDGPLSLLNNTLSIYDEDSINSDVYIQSFTAYLIDGTYNESLMAGNSTITEEIQGNQIVLRGNHTLEEYQIVARSLVYINTNDELVCPLYRNITLIIEDEMFTSNVTVSFNLIPRNDKQPVVMPQYSNRNFSEESAGVMVFATVSITDADEECENNTLQFAHITLYGADDGEDESISIIYCNDSDIGSGSGYECNLDPENVTMMTMEERTLSITRQLVDGNTRLIITGEAPIVIYQDLIRMIFYNNTADEPEIRDRMVSLLASDGDLNSTAYANITIIPVADNNPVINPNGDPTITENMGPVPIIYNITDDDQLAEHQLIYWINISLDNAIDKDDILLVNGTILSNTSYLVNCTDCSSLDCCIDRVQNVTYNNIADEPPNYPLWRTFTVQIQAIGSDSPLEYRVNISIVLVNDNPPVLQVNGSAPASEIFVTQFTEDGSPVPIFNDPMISDGDVGNNFITSVAIEVDDEGDMTNTVNDQFSYDNDITDLDVTDTHGLLEISGNATAQEYMNLLSTVHYSNTLPEPNDLYQERSIIVTIREDDQFYMANITVNLIPVNDPAQFNFNNRTIDFDEATRDPVMLFKPTDKIIDPDQDGGNLNYATLTLYGPTVHEGDMISIDSINAGSLLNYSNETHINISGIAPIREYLSILRTATFVNRRVDSPSTPRRVIVNTFDGIENSLGPNIYININTTDDPPLCFIGGNIDQSTFETVLQCDGRMICETELCPEGVPCFNITDFDSDDTFPDNAIAMVTMSVQNPDEEITFADSSKVERIPVQDVTILQYQISSVSTYSELTELLRSAVYNSTELLPATRIRTINVSISVGNINGSQECQVHINVLSGRLITVLPSRLQRDPVLNYTEDSGPILLIPESLQNEFSFMEDAEVDFGYRVTLTIVAGSNDDEGQLILPSDFSASDVIISGTNTSQITVEHSYRRFNNAPTPLANFDAVFKAVQISFNDDTPRSCVREAPYDGCATLEFVNADGFYGGSLVTRLYVAIKGINDRPVLMRLRNNFTVLDDYLPPENNRGFNISFLITENEVTDADRAPYNPDFVGLAVVNVTNGMVDFPAGFWQYRTSFDEEWMNIMNISDCDPVFIHPDGIIHFHPIANPARSDINVTLTIRAWDGTSENTTCTSGIANDTLSVSANTETFTYHLVYLNRAPFAVEHEYNISTVEDVPSEAVNVSDIVMSLGAVDPEGTELGVVVIFVDNNNIGYWQYQPESTGNWTNIPYSTEENAFLLYPNDSLHFSPARNIFGNSYITVLAAEVEDIMPPVDRIVDTSTDNLYTSSYSMEPINISVVVSSVLDPPVLDCPITEVIYHENMAPVYIFDNLTITSIETDYLASATVKLITEENITDMVHYPNTSAFDIAISDPHCYTITAILNNSINAFQYFLRQISFSIQNGIEIEPSVQMRRVMLIVTDSYGTNSNKSVEVNITLVNDQRPSISLPEDNVTFVEGQDPLQLFVIPPDVTDPDDNPYQRSTISSVYIYLYYHDPDFERLSFNMADDNIMGSFDGNYLMLSGNARVEDYEQAFTRIYYHNNESEPHPNALQRVLRIGVFDGNFYSLNASLTINIALVNDQPPTIRLSGVTMNNTVSFTEGTIPMPIFIAPLVVITDEDSDSTTSVSYSIYVEILNPADDEAIFRTYSTSASTSFTIDDPTSLEDIQQVLSGLQYINNAVEPTGSYRLVHVDIFDTYDESGSTFMDTAYVRVEFILTDDLPQFHFNMTAIMYQEGDGPVEVAPDLTIIDVDDTEISSAVIELTSANVTLNFSTEIINIDEMLLHGTNISLSQSNGTLSLTGIDHIETYEEILRTLTYNYTIAMGDPVEGKRTLLGYVEGTRINTTSNMDTLAICFASIDNSPIIDLNGRMQGGRNYETVFIEEGDSVAVTSDVAFVEDVDSTILQYINVTLTNPVDGDEEGIMLESYYNHRIHYNMEDSPSTFTEILQNITYFNSADEPNTEQRIIIITASDGSTYSTPVQSTISIRLVDDVPQMFLDGTSGSVNYSTTFTENGDPVYLTFNPVINDSDAVNVNQLLIILSPAEGVVTASVQLHRVNNGSWLYNETTTLERITEIISSLRYEDQTEEPVPGDRLICLSVTIDGARSNIACTEVAFIPVDDSPVRFTMNFTGNVFENQPGMNVTQVMAEDDDSTNSEVNITYSIVSITGVPYDQGCPAVGSGDNETTTIDADPFTIDQISGWISTTVDSPPDREMYSSFILIVEATDGEYNDTTYVNIDVEDLNDNCPTFYPTMYFVTVSQGAEADSHLVNLSACDPDGDRIDTDINDSGITTMPAPTVPLFGISELGFQLRVPESFLIERNQSTYDVEVCIKSFFAPNGDAVDICNVETATVRVNVQVNTATPQFIVDSYNVSIPENTIAAFLQVTATDSDTGSNAIISYDIISDMTSLPFSINSTTGSISVIQSLDFEQRNNYSFLVSATDQGFYPKSSTVSVKVWVENINDEPPVFDQSEYTASVLENVSVPYDLIKVQASDTDGVTITYELTNLDPSVTDLFEINATTGVISVVNATLLDHERFGTINFMVRANDSLNTAEVGISVNIIDINEAPVFTMAIYNVMINESFTPNMFPDEEYASGLDEFLQVSGELYREILQVMAIDPDDDDVTYSFSSPQNYFVINASTGVITSHTIFDREVTETYSIPVQATDSVNNVASATVEIRVLDINDNMPTFIPQAYNKTIPEDLLNGSNVLQVTVCDLDESITENAIQLTITSTNIPFNLTTPVMVSNDCYVSDLFLTSSLDHETTTVHSLTVEASDTGTPSLTGMGMVSIAVSDVNDNPPVIKLTYIIESIPEVAAVGSFIANFTVTDADSGMNAEYMVVTSSGVTAANGTILLAQQLDYEEATEFFFTITVMNTALPRFTTTMNVTVAVGDVNDVPAVLTFENKQVIFYEGFTTIPLNPGITISDNDSTLLYSATVGISISSLEPHFSFTPNSDLLPYNCPLEDKLDKFSSCGFTDVVLLTDDSEPDIITLHNDAVLDGTTLYLNASNEQYMIYPGQTNLDITNGASILFWVRKNRVPTSSVQPILTKGSIFSDENLFSISCFENNALGFSFYNSTEHQLKVAFNYNCSDLEDAWHHVGIVLSSQIDLWSVTLHVDGIVVDSQVIDAPIDDIGQFFIGTDINKMNYFDGAVHFVIVSTKPANEKNDINCAIGCGVTLQSLMDTPLSYKYLYDNSTLLISGTGSLSVYEDFFNSLYFISTFSELYSDRYILDFDVIEVSPNEIDYADKTMEFLFEIELFYINEGSPVLLLDGNVSPNYETSFIEEGPAVSLVNVDSLSLTDPDLNPSNYTVTVTLMDPLQGDEERLDVNGEFPLLQINRSQPQYLTISGNTNIIDIEEAVKRVVYINTAEELNGTHRIVGFVVDDDYRNQPLRSEPVTTHITFVPVNDPPEITLQPLYVNYTEGDVIDLVDDISITDNDGSVITMAVITLTGFDETEERIDIDTNGTDIVTQYSSNYSIIELTGNATHSEYQQVLANLTYFHSSESPTGGTRIVTIRISDGDKYSEPTNIMIFFQSINDAPVLDPNGPLAGLKFVTEFVEDMDVAVNVLSSNFTLLDPDNSSLAYISLHLVDAPDGDQEFLRVNFTTDQTIVINPDNIGSSYIAAFEEVLATAVYVNEAEEPTGGIRNITFIVSDGIDLSIVYTCVQVSVVNDAPQLDLNGNETEGFNYYTTYIDSGGPVPITNNVIIHDNDENSVITSFTISLRNPVDGAMEMIAFDPQNYSLNCTYNMASSIHCNVADFSADQVAEILNTVSYNNTNDEPNMETREVDFMISDGIVYSNVASAFINITLVNEHNPQFIRDNYSVNIEENEPADTEVVIANFGAFDNDNGRDGEISYSIYSGNDLQHFSINASSGAIYTDVILDSEIISSYQLVVVATDNGVPPRSGTVSVQITVIDQNDNAPQFAQDTNFSFSVSELANINEIIYSISAMDADDGDTITFSFEGGQNVIDVTLDGKVIVLNNLDADNATMAPVYTINVTIADNRGLSTTETFTISVIDENDNLPSFLFDSYTIFVSEGISVGERIGEEVIAVDNDVTSNLTYSIINSSTFVIANGQYLIVAVPLDREAEDQYSLILSVSDGLHNATTLVRISITDINDNPPTFDRPSYNFTISENTISFSEFVTASDADLGRNSEITYIIFDPVVDVIQINDVTGEITLLNPLDFETMPSIVFTVYAIDNGNPSLNSSVLVTIIVENINEEIPMFTQAVYIANVEEGIENITVMTVSLFNDDNAFVFGLEEDFDTFVIDPVSGEITTVVSLDYEANCAYQLIVTATNLEHQSTNSLLQSTATVVVLVVNVHDVVPVFNQSMYAVSIYENQEAGSLVTVVYATDEDSSLQLCPLEGSGNAVLLEGSGNAVLLEGSGSGEGQIEQSNDFNSELRYSLNNYMDFFMINSLTGEITTRVMLDREKNTRYSISVTVIDAANASDTTIVNVIVLDVNDNRPSFTSENYSASVEENTPVGSSVLRVIAEDRDMLDNGTLRYTLPDEVTAFSISSSTGVISVSAPLDFDGGPVQYSFIVSVHDSASQSGTAVVTIDILDLNDVPPTVSNVTTSITFSEGQVSIRALSTIVISDEDSFQSINYAEVRLIVPNTAVAVSGECRCSDSQNSSTCGPEGCNEFLQLAYDFPGMAAMSRHNDSIVTLTLSGTYDISTYTSALRSVEYINIISNPSFEPRSLYVMVNDGIFDSNPVMQSIVVEPFNVFAPVLDLNGIDMDGNNFSTSFTESGSPVPIVSIDIQIVDNDTDASLDILTSAVVEIVNPLNGNSEYLTSLQMLPGIIIQGNMSHRMTLTGERSLGAYQQVLLGLRYANNMPEPFLTSRQIRFTLHQYQHISEPVYTTINIIGVNDHRPMIFLGGDNVQNYENEFLEESTGVPITSSSVRIIDMDSGDDVILSLVIAPLFSSFVSSDRIFISDMSQFPATITVNDAGSGYLTLNGPASIADFTSAVKLVYYQNTDEEFIIGNSLSKVLSVTVSDSSLSSIPAYVTITLTSINDHQPVFNLSLLEISVSELLPLNSVIAVLTAVDGDTLIQPTTMYTILNDSSPFYLNETTGELINIHTLDSETLPRPYVLAVQARDSEYNGELLPGVLTLSILFEDENDNAPFFPVPLYNASVAENVTIGTIVITVTATDIDVNEANRHIVYEILNSNDFAIDSNGNVITNTMLDRERQEFYDLTIVARHPSDISSSGTALLSISVSDVDDNNPVLMLNPDSGVLVEPATMITLSDMLTIIDHDVNPTLTYATVNISGYGQLISLHNTSTIDLVGNNSRILQYTGKASIQEYEQVLRNVVYQDNAAEPIPRPRYIHFIIGSQNRGSVSTFILSVTVINDNPPYLTLDRTNSSDPGDLENVVREGAYFTTFIEEGDPVSITRYSLDITDADRGINYLSYAIVFIKDSIDNELLTVYLTGNIQLTTDSNNTWLNLTGPATIEQFEYVLRGIRYVNLADEPTKELTEIVFYLNDGMFNSNMPTAYVTISRINDAPVITLGLNETVDITLMYVENQSLPLLPAQNIQINDAENDPISLVNIIIYDRLPEETLTISTSGLIITDTTTGMVILSPTGTSAAEFERILGTLQYQNSLTMGPIQSPRLISFTATDNLGEPSMEAFAIINFESVDNPPMIDLNGNLIAGVNFSTTFTEGSSMIPIVSPQASITDVDSDELHLMAISFMNIPDLAAEDLVIQNTTGVMGVERYRDDSSLFINITGQRPISDYLSVLRSVQYVNIADEPTRGQREISIQVYSTSDLTGSSSAYSLINIAHINDHSPVFSRDVYNGSVLENATASTRVNVTVFATDNDRYGSTNITYRLSPDVINFVIDPLTGIITTTDRMLDREVEDIVTFTVLAIDNDVDLRTGTAIVTINVLDVNDNPPIFNPLTFALPIIISEDMPTGSVIASVTATDTDASSNGQIMYQVSSRPLPSNDNDTSEGPFDIATEDGVAILSLVRSLDRETVSGYTVTIEAIDGVFTDAVNIDVNVSDVNDNAPIFTNLPMNITLSEDTPVGTMEIYQVTAEDADLNAVIQFSLLNSASIFTINSTTGAISLSDSLDFEQTREHVLNIQASDSTPPIMTSQGTLFINVSNVNEPPQFNPDVYTMEVEENSFISITLTASDPENDVLSYVFNEVPIVDVFNINPFTGVVSSSDVLDYDQQQINLTVRVTDSGGNFDIANVFITVLDVNDNAPMFDRTVYSVAVSENAPVNYLVITVTATDADSSSNGLITYDIAESNGVDVFGIDQNSGSIVLLSSLDFESTSMYNLTVIAVDMGTPAQTGSAIVQVNVSNVNDEPPVLTINTPLMTYVENSDEIVIAADLEIADDDGSLHPLFGASVILDAGECRLSSEEIQDACQQQEPSCISYCAEMLTFNRNLLSVYGLTELPESTEHAIYITGNASENSYQEVLNSFAYVNFADEPYAGDRTVSFQVADQQGRAGESNIINVTVRVELIDEHCPVVSSVLNSASFVEGSNSTYVGQNIVFSVSDRDREPHKMLTMLEITLMNRRSEESISVAENGPMLVTSHVDGSDLVIRVQGAATTELYRQLLQTLVYSNTQDEPTLNERLIVISPFVVGGLQCTTYNIIINITPINDNPPVLTTDVQTIEYTEGSGTLMFAQASGLRVTDRDHNEIFNIVSAEVILTNVQDDGSEVLGFSTPPPDGANLIQENHRISINYAASVSVYNSLLRSLTYRNEDPEPTPGMRIIELRVYDGDHSAHTMLIIVVISINDNRVMLEAGDLTVVFPEGTTELRVGQEAMLVLMDSDGEISSLQITLSNRLDESEEIRIADSNSASISANATSIFISGIMSVDIYQNILNNLIYSYPQAVEPLAGTRTITISASDDMSTSTVTITLEVQLVNNHDPIVDLNGPIMDGLNYSTILNFNYAMPNRVAIAAPNVHITDADIDAFINKMEIRLNEESEDLLVMDLPNCYLPQGLAQISCHIMMDLQFSCMCNENLTPSQDLRTLAVNLTQKAITMVQPQGLVSFEMFQNLLANVVQFQHNPAPPSSSYSSVVTTVIFDGQFYSQPAFTTVAVQLLSPSDPPILDENDMTNVRVVVKDGTSSVLIAMNAIIANSNTMLQGMIVTLTNIIHTGEEYLYVNSTEPNITLPQTRMSDELSFSGRATVQSYASLLQTIGYNYSRMSSIIDNAPNLTPRIIYVAIVDIDGQLSQRAQINITLDDTCSQTIEGDTVTVSYMRDFEKLSNCRGLELDLNIRDATGTEINSLIPLSDLRFVNRLTINNVDTLTNLEGLEGLKSYTSLEIINNEGLLTLQHLSSNYTPLGLTVRSVHVSTNRRLRDIIGLQHIANVTGDCYLYFNSMLRNLSGLNNILQINNLAIFYLPVTDLNIANSLWKANSITILQNTALQRVTGFQRLREIHTLVIQSNVELQNIDGFGGILSVFSITISSNPSLCYILNQNPDRDYWQGLGAQETSDVTISSSCPQRSCSDNPCYNGGQCENTENGYSCMCTDTGYYNGDNLQGCLFFNTCQSEPCLNGGTCELDELHLLGYRCN